MNNLDGSLSSFKVIKFYIFYANFLSKIYDVDYCPDVTFTSFKLRNKQTLQCKFIKSREFKIAHISIIA